MHAMTLRSVRSNDNERHGSASSPKPYLPPPLPAPAGPGLAHLTCTSQKTLPLGRTSMRELTALSWLKPMALRKAKLQRGAGYEVRVGEWGRVGRRGGQSGFESVLACVRGSLNS